MKAIQKLSVLFIVLLVVIGCSKDDGPVPMEEPVKSSAKRITGFVFKAEANATLDMDIPGAIDETAKTITATLPFGTDVSALSPEISYSDKASVSPVGTRDFSNSVSYTVTAEDGSQATYSASANIAPNGEAQILTFQFLLSENPFDINVVARIDHDAGTIEFDVPDGADITALLPNILVSEGASFSPGGVQNFKEDLVFTVTAGNGAHKEYQVITKYSQRGVLFEIYKANPDNTLDWDLENENLEEWNGVDTDAEGNIIELQLVDGGLTHLPPAFIHLKELLYLNLSFNSFESIPPEIFELSNLNSLRFTKNALTSLPPEIGQLENLRTLDLAANDSFLDGNKGKKNSKSKNGAYINKIVELPKEIGQLKALEFLVLSELGLEILPSEIGALIALKRLYLDSNLLASLPDEIGQLEVLEVLDLRQNQLEELPTSIGGLHNLERLNVGWNALTAIPLEIGQLANLRTLDLGNTDSETVENQSIKNTIQTLPKEIGGLLSLQGLYTANVNLQELPPEIGQLQSLLYLEAWGNNLSTLPPEIGSAMQLQELDLNGNFLHEIPNEIGQLTNLRNLYLGDNLLEVIPVEMGNLSQLARLHLNDNYFEYLPWELGQLYQLTLLDIRNNPNLFGIPLSVCDLESDLNLQILKDEGVLCVE